MATKDSALLDTSTLLWWLLNPDELSNRATQICGQHGPFKLAISSISIWEIGIKVKKGKLELGTTFEDFAERLSRLENFDIIAVDEKIWIENLSLSWKHRDPADRTIVATAKLRELPLVTKDQSIRNFYKKAIW